MPGNLHVRNLDDDLIIRLKRRATRRGRSAEAEHREILRQALSTEVEPTFVELGGATSLADPGMPSTRPQKSLCVKGATSGESLCH